MASRFWSERFLRTTRGRVVALLRRSEHTVNELAAVLGVSDNAVRSHLAALERDGLVESRGVRRGVGQPARVYGLAPEASAMFHKGCALILIGLLDTARARLSIRELRQMVRDAGRQCGRSLGRAAGSRQERLEAGVAAFNSLGGRAELERQGARPSIWARECAFGDLARTHPEVCELAATLLGEISGARLAQQCQRTPDPRCRFRLMGNRR